MQRIGDISRTRVSIQKLKVHPNRGQRNSPSCKSMFYTWYKQNTLYGLQAVPKVPSTPLEDLCCDLVKRKGCSSVEACRVTLDSERGGFKQCRAVSYNLPAQHQREYLFQHMLQHLMGFLLKNAYIVPRYRKGESQEYLVA